MNQTVEGSADIAPIGRRAGKALAVRQALFDAGLEAFELQPISMVSALDTRRPVKAINAAMAPASAS